MPAKVMVIGWDSCDFGLIRPWADKGNLATIKRLIDHGRSGKLLSVHPPVTATAWSTIVTGKNAGKHGVYEFASLKKNSYDAFPLNASHRNGMDLWEILSEKGKKVAVIGVPMTFPVRKVNGCLVSGFLTPNDDVDFTYPAELKKELNDNVPGYATNPSYLFDYGGKQNDDKYIDALFQVLDKHIEGTKYLAKNKEWDFFMGVFNETDWIQHKFWSAIDPNHPHYTKDRANRYGDIILKVYAKLDRALDELIDIAGPLTHVMIISDHGVGPQYKKIMTNNFLLQIGSLKLRRNPGTIMRRVIARLGINPAEVRRLMKFLGTPIPYSARSAKGGILMQSARSVFITKDDIDWKRTKAFAPFGSGLIFINRKGYFPVGIVDESAYEAVRNEIQSKLLRLKDRGINVIEKVFYRDQLFEGEKAELAADIQFHCVPGYFPVGSFSQGAGGVIVDSESVSGAHSMNGIFILHEASLMSEETNSINESLKSNSRQISDARLVDVVPTILHLFDLPISRDLDGRSLASSSEPIKYESGSDMGAPGDAQERVTAYSQEEQEDIESRLRSLGYV